jgi:hypothetical protein
MSPSLQRQRRESVRTDVKRWSAQGRAVTLRVGRVLQLSELSCADERSHYLGIHRPSICTPN